MQLRTMCLRKWLGLFDNYNLFSFFTGKHSCCQGQEKEDIFHVMLCSGYIHPESSGKWSALDFSPIPLNPLQGTSSFHSSFRGGTNKFFSRMRRAHLKALPPYIA